MIHWVHILALKKCVVFSFYFARVASRAASRAALVVPLVKSRYLAFRLCFSRLAFAIKFGGDAASGDGAHNVFNDGLVESRMPPKCSSNLFCTMPKYNVCLCQCQCCLYRSVPVYTKVLAAVVVPEFFAAVSPSVPRESVL